MDQDFHYYGTIYAALAAGWDEKNAVMIGKSANFTDMFTNKNYDGPWRLIYDPDAKKNLTGPDQGFVAGKVDKLRYTFQDSLAGTAAHPATSTFAAFHFLPGNFVERGNSPSVKGLHGDYLAECLEKHVVRKDTGFQTHAKWLTRPLSPISRMLIQDTLSCFRDNGSRVNSILKRSVGGAELVNHRHGDTIRKQFMLILLGLRAHVVADTWAHQDFSGGSSKINTYKDISHKHLIRVGKRVKIDDRTKGEYKKVRLGFGSNLVGDVLKASPSTDRWLGVGKARVHSDVGHAWMGHLPDYCWISYKYLPAWSKEEIERHNPIEYWKAFWELFSFFYMAKQLFDGSTLENLQKVNGFVDGILDINENVLNAITGEVELSKKNIPRHESSKKWLKIKKLRRAIKHVKNATVNVIKEGKNADENTMLGRPFYYDKSKKEHLVSITSDLYLFHIAADYHYRFVKYWLKEIARIDIASDPYTTWNEEWGRGPLAGTIEMLFERDLR